MKNLFFLYFFFLNYMAFSQTLIDTRWQVVEIPQEKSKKMTNIEKNNLYIHFGKNDAVSFNFDVNGCGGTYKIDENKKTIAIGKEITCTQACCDKIGIPYVSVTSYKRKKNKLTLYTSYKQKIVLKLFPVEENNLKEKQD